MTQPTPLPIPKSAADDAKQRAIRAYLTGLGAAVLTSTLPLLDAAANNIHWSTAWWIAIGNTLVQPAVHAAITYVARHVAPPQ